MSTKTTLAGKEKLLIEDKRKLDVCNMMCIENSSGAILLEPMEANISDNVSLEEHTLTLFNKRQTIGNSKFSTDKNKRNRVEIETELGHYAHDNPWCIKKQLYKIDLRNLSRLLLPSELVESRVLLYRNTDQLAQIQ
ncbi:hypothetical protein Goklo_026842 [Gossypium klotzschianum]|uniref:Uncharacterized protein n=1 Tax=Gossypium klotzschianum TaxID=34286 RepID=A0A7J8TWB6_9ROSI|nr:hypothetical protein [Gossypium klotzschianum]